MNEEEIELELKKFNWGAFGFSVFWGIGNKVYISYLRSLKFDSYDLRK